MARAMLRDDYGAYLNRPGIGLDDDSRTSVPAGLRPFPDDTVPNDPEVPSTTVNPLVTVRQRYQTGYDFDGNPEYGWHPLVTDAEAIQFVSRTESSDTSGLTVVKSTVTLLYTRDLPDVHETATVTTSDGFLWQVTNVERFPDRLQLALERLVDGE
ncbi:hypothetical protein SEA_DANIELLEIGNACE_18 [Arthrobacter phage DanielleIgnace]|nr:hypothetical protein SEA_DANIELLEIGNACE_18 [Arthrobacter phage DanielleIgnace]